MRETYNEINKPREKRTMREMYNERKHSERVKTVKE